MEIGLYPVEHLATILWRVRHQLPESEWIAALDRGAQWARAAHAQARDEFARMSWGARYRELAAVRTSLAIFGRRGV
jgi:hypothetical protein